jgi:phosphoserine phosphatase
VIVSDQGPSPRLDADALERILDVTRALARPLDVNTMLEQVIDAGRSILGADRGTVFLYDARTDELVSRVATGTGELRVPAERGIVGECARSRNVINVPDCYADPRFNAEVDRKTGYRTRCLMAVPLIGHDDSLVGVLQVLNKEVDESGDGGVFDDRDERVATALGAQCAVALQRMRLLEDLVAKERMERELAVAREIQKDVFPREMPRIAGYEIAGWCRPADQTGGDIYDLIPVEAGKLLLVLGDATGHGIGPALSVTQFRAMLRMCARCDTGLDDAVLRVNDQLAEDLAANRFVTAFVGLLDPGAHAISYHAGGHGPLLLLRATGEADWRDSSTIPLGIMPGLPLDGGGSCDLRPGDTLVVVTDGILEYENPAEEQFGRDRMLAVARECAEQPVSRLVEGLVEAVERFSEGAPQKDDMTVLAVRRAAS